MNKIIIANWRKRSEGLGGQESYFSDLSNILNARIISYIDAEKVMNKNLFSDPFRVVYIGYVIDKYLENYEKLFKPDLIIKNSAVGGFTKLKTPQITIFQDPYYSISQKLIENGRFSNQSEHYFACIELQRRTAKQGKTVAVSNFMKKDMELCGIKCDKIIEEGVDIEKFKPLNKEELKKAHNIPLDKKVGIAVTKFNSIKGWDMLAKLINKFSDIYWIVVLTSEIGSKPKLKNVSIAEKVDPTLMPQFYNLADFYISTSSVESFGLSSAEALACNLPVVVFKTGIFWDWFDKRLGIRVEDWTIEAFEKAVEKIRDSDLKEFSPRQTLIKRGLTKEIMEKNWKNYVNEILNKKD